MMAIPVRVLCRSEDAKCETRSQSAGRWLVLAPLVAEIVARGHPLRAGLRRGWRALSRRRDEGEDLGNFGHRFSRQNAPKSGRAGAEGEPRGDASERGAAAH